MAEERNIFRHEIKLMTATGLIFAFAEMPTKFSKSTLRWRVMRHHRAIAFQQKIFISTRNIISA